MATVGVVSLGDKLHVLGNTAAVDNSKRQLIILRKPAKLVPDPNESNILLTNASRRKPRTGKEMTKVPHPPPIAVARRNARERNRVKQVNNGFATLRQHIPTAIAAAYESGSGRGTNKKLSKVETLRMAVEYIKSLEKLLALSNDENSTLASNSSPTDQSYTTIPSISPASSHLTYSYASHLDDDELGNSRTKMIKHEYLMETHLYEDEENLYPAHMDGMDEDILNETSLVDTKLELSNSHDISLLHSMDNTASLSPEVYSEHSLSPASLDPNGSKSYIPVFEVSGGGALPPFAHLSYERLPPVKSELLSPSAPPLHSRAADHISDSQTLAVSEQSSMIQVMAWWQQQNRS